MSEEDHSFSRSDIAGQARDTTASKFEADTQLLVKRIDILENLLQQEVPLADAIAHMEGLKITFQDLLTQANAAKQEIH